MNIEEKIQQYIKDTKGFTPEEIIEFSSKEFNSKVAFATSLGEEDQVITDMISK